MNFVVSGDFLAHRLPDERVCLCVDGGGRVVHDQDLRLFQQCPRDAQPLLLAAGDVRAALFDIGVIFVGEGLDELIRLRKLADANQVFIRRVLIAPNGGYL